MNDEIPGGRFDRRRFLKGVAATGAVAAIGTGYSTTVAQTAIEKNSATKSWRDRPDPIDEKLISDGGTYDVVVVGGMFGLGAGMSATTDLDTDADGHVLDSDFFKPIEGLYAAGNNAGGRFKVVYQSPISGISIGMTMTEGYMLGERLAKL